MRRAKPAVRKRTLAPREASDPLRPAELAAHLAFGVPGRSSPSIDGLAFACSASAFKLAAASSVSAHEALTPAAWWIVFSQASKKTSHAADVLRLQCVPGIPSVSLPPERRPDNVKRSAVASERGAERGAVPNPFDRRRYRRIKMPILCRRAGGDYFAHIEPVDISFGGLRVYSSEQYPLRGRVRLDLFFPKAAPVTFATQVSWIRPATPGAPARFDVGLAFIQLTPQAMGALLPFVGPEAEPEPAEPALDLAPKPAESAVLPNLAESAVLPKPAESAVLPKPAESAVLPKPAESAVLIVEDELVSEPRLIARAPRSFLSEIPIRVAADELVRASPLDERAGFILWLLDGATTVETLLDLSSMPADETLALLQDLQQHGIIQFR
jgi:hypothetical protein